MLFVRTALLFLLLAASLEAQKLTPLAPRLEWSSLGKFQRTITKEEFTRLLTQVYAPREAWRDSFTIAEDHATVVTTPGQPLFRLDFAPDEASAKPIPRYWKPTRSLRGLRIAIDPGHLGGEWARMEERWFQIGENKPVIEGNMVLEVAELLQKELERRGAKVVLLRTTSKPATNLRPEKLRTSAAASLRERGRPVNPASLKAESERLFYRTAEIHARARLVNQRYKPDLVLALHFNAEAWGNPARHRHHLRKLPPIHYRPHQLNHSSSRSDSPTTHPASKSF